jgi:hypothetical protein
MPLQLRAKMQGSAFTLLRRGPTIAPEVSSVSTVVAEEPMSADSVKADSVKDVVLMSEEAVIEGGMATVASLLGETTLNSGSMGTAAGEVNLDTERINGTSSAESHSVIESAVTTSALLQASGQISSHSSQPLHNHTNNCALNSTPSTGTASVLPSIPRWSSAASGVVVREALRQAVGNPSVLVGWEVSNQSIDR